MAYTGLVTFGWVPMPRHRHQIDANYAYAMLALVVLIIAAYLVGKRK